MNFSPSKMLSRYGINKFIKELSRSHIALKHIEMKNLFIGAGGEFQELTKKLVVSNLESLDIDPSRRPDILSDAHDMHTISNNIYDCVFAFEVLEHCHSPHLVCEEIHRILKPGGLCIGSTPFIYPLHDLPYDYFRFTEFGLRKIFEDFEVLKLESRQNYFASIVTLISRTLHASNKKTRILSILLSPYLLILCLGLLSLNFLSKNQGTGGYIFMFRKGIDKC